MLRMGSAVDRWDLATVGSWTIQADEPGERRPTLADAPVERWRSRHVPAVPEPPELG